MSLTQVAVALLPLVDKVPKDEDVKAGWTAFALFIGLGVAVALLGVSLTRHLRTAERNLGGSEDDASADAVADGPDSPDVHDGPEGTTPGVASAERSAESR